jgi:hypothetical protein
MGQVVERFRLRSNFGEGGIWVDWTVGSCLHSLHLVGLDDDTVVREHRVRSSEPAGRVARHGIGSGDAHRSQVDVAEAIEWVRGRREVDPSPIVYEWAGFTNNLELTRRPRGNPRIPDLLLAAIAKLREEYPSRRELSELLDIGDLRPSIKNWVYAARERGLFQGGGKGRRDGRATEHALRLLAEDGRDAVEIVRLWWTRRVL